MTTHFQPDGGIAGAYLVNQLAGQRPVDRQPGLHHLGGPWQPRAAGPRRRGHVRKLNYLDAGGTERTGLAVTTGTSSPIISVAPEANGAATLDLENNSLTGVKTVVPSPDNHGQLDLDGLLALTPQAEPATPAHGGVLYVDSADGALNSRAARAPSPPSPQPESSRPLIASAAGLPGQNYFLRWWGGWGSNPRPTDYESAALTG